MHSYATEDEVGDDQDEEECIEDSQSLAAGNSSDLHISKFLKLPRGYKRATKVSRAKPIIDYS